MDRNAPIEEVLGEKGSGLVVPTCGPRVFERTSRNLPHDSVEGVHREAERWPRYLQWQRDVGSDLVAITDSGHHRSAEHYRP